MGNDYFGSLAPNNGPVGAEEFLPPLSNADIARLEEDPYSFWLRRAHQPLLDLGQLINMDHLVSEDRDTDLVDEVFDLEVDEVTDLEVDEPLLVVEEPHLEVDEVFDLEVDEVTDLEVDEPLLVVEEPHLVVDKPEPMAIEEAPMFVSDEELQFFFENDIDQLGEFENVPDGWMSEDWGIDHLQEVCGLDDDGDNTTETTIDAFFDSARTAPGDRPPKRRRITGKQTFDLESIARPPRTRIKNAAASRGVTAPEFKRMLLVGLPLVLLNCLCFLHAVVPAQAEAAVACAEMFSGAGHVALPFKPRAAEFDINRGDMEDVNSAAGFLTALRVIRDVDHEVGRKRGMSHWGTVCSSWIYLCRASTERSLASPLGNTKKLNVRMANQMVARVCILIMFGCCLRIVYLHEQPASSLASSTKFFLWLRSTLMTVLQQRWTRFLMWMGAWGGQIQKPTEIISNADWAPNLQQPLSPERRLAMRGALGIQHLPMDEGNMKRRVSGCSDLKDTQVYPPEYGAAVHDNWQQFGDTMPDDESVSSDDELPWNEWKAAAQMCNWAELNFEELEEFAGVPSESLLP